MKIAYLIMAHDQPEHLQRLVRVLDCVEATFYIHIDRKVDVAPFQALLGNGKNVHFLSDRVNANWMGFSLVEAILRLLAAAVREGFGYCVLLSGSDYPIKSRVELLSFFAQADKEYIAFWRLEDRPSWKHKVEYYYPIDAIPIRDWSMNREAAYWRRLFWGRFFKYQKFMPKRRFLRNMVAYGGPDWWSLSYECAAFVLKFVDDNPNYTRFYRFTQSPGEMFFQTIILNSDWGRRIENFDAYERWRAGRGSTKVPSDAAMLADETFNYRYADWSGEATAARETPAILDERDWTKIRKSRGHFARKFDAQRSAALLDLIDREILGVAR